MERANAVPFGLAGYIFTNSLKTATLASEAMETGMVGVNEVLLASAESPFGGIKESGLGREGGLAGHSRLSRSKIHQNQTPEKINVG